MFYSTRMYSPTTSPYNDECGKSFSLFTIPVHPRCDHEEVDVRTVSYVPYGRGYIEKADKHDTLTDTLRMAHVRSTRRPSTGRSKWYIYKNVLFCSKTRYCARAAAHVSVQSGKMSARSSLSNDL